MDPELAQQIQERFAQLPADIQRAIQSSDMEETLREIGQTHGLHIDQMGALGDEVRLVMLGFADPADFASAFAAQAHVSAEDAAKIGDEVAEKIFLPIRESMKKFMEERELDDAAGVVAAEPAPTIPTSGGAPTHVPSVPATPTPVPVMQAAQTILTQPTVTPATNPAPRPYKTDPYREPAE